MLTWAECPPVARHKLHAETPRADGGALSGKASRTPAAPATMCTHECECFGVSGTRGPTQGSAGKEAGDKGGHEGMKMGMKMGVPVTPLPLRFVPRALLGRWGL